MGTGVLHTRSLPFAATARDMRRVGARKSLVIQCILHCRYHRDADIKARTQITCVNRSVHHHIACIFDSDLVVGAIVALQCQGHVEFDVACIHNACSSSSCARICSGTAPKVLNTDIKSEALEKEMERHCPLVRNATRVETRDRQRVEIQGIVHNEGHTHHANAFRKGAGIYAAPR